MIRYIDEISSSDLAGTALVRIDLNTADRWRLEASIPTLEFLFDHAEKVVILSHRGHPVLEEDKEHLSLRVDTDILFRRLSRRVTFVNTRSFDEAKRLIADAESHSVFLLENLRFWEGEEVNDSEFAKSLATLGDYYVNDAFAVSHRVNASVVAITTYMPSYGGLSLRREIQTLSSVLGEVEHPFIVVLGGAKPETKLSVIDRLRISADAILVGGVLANQLIEDSTRDPKLVLPTDFVEEEGRKLDIGKNSIEAFVQKLQSAKTIVWNGPLGRTEDERYARGTEAIARAIASNSGAFTVAGGGETVMTIRNLGLENSFSFLSTGGGAMLDFLAGKTLPGIAALETQKSS